MEKRCVGMKEVGMISGMRDSRAREVIIEPRGYNAEDSEDMIVLVSILVSEV